MCQSDAVVFFFRWSRRVVLSLTLMRFLSLRFWYRHTLKHTSSSLRGQRAAEEDSGWHFQNKADEEEVSSTSDQTSENHHKKQRHYLKGSLKFTDLYLFTFYCNEVKEKNTNCSLSHYFYCLLVKSSWIFLFKSEFYFLSFTVNLVNNIILYHSMISSYRTCYVRDVEQRVDIKT